jgi:hypothetical protein
MKINILTAILCVSFASACSVNEGSNATNTTTSNTNQTNSSANTTSAANTTKPAASPAAEKKTETRSSKPDIDKDGNEHIQFPKGSTDTSIERTLAPNDNKMLLFNVRKGQTLWFKATESTNQLEVDFNKNSVKLGEEVRQELNASGDWAIYVNNPTDKPLTYKLWIGIE